MDLSKLVWEAVHTSKTVKAPNYIDVRRNTLQSVRLIKKGIMKSEVLFEFTRPEGVEKWLISWRMRTQIVNGEIFRRFWIFNDRSRDEVTRVHNNLSVTKGTWEQLGIKPATIGAIDNT